MCAQPLIPQPSLHPLLERGQGGETHRGAKGVKHTGGRNLGETHPGDANWSTCHCYLNLPCFCIKTQLTSISVQISF